eukprot:scaffold2306_cov95-Isochrysis_galbana.AAC.3
MSLDWPLGCPPEAHRSRAGCLHQNLPTFCAAPKTPVPSRTPIFPVVAASPYSSRKSAPAVPARPSARRQTWPRGPRRPTELRGPPSRAAIRSQERR